MMLTNLGAPDGLAELEAIRTGDTDVMLLRLGHACARWHRGASHRVPAPESAGHMLITRAQRSHVNETLRAGANEFPLKPTSPNPLCDRLMAIVLKPRPMVKVGTFNVTAAAPHRYAARNRAGRLIRLGRQSQRSG